MLTNIYTPYVGYLGISPSRKRREINDVKVKIISSVFEKPYTIKNGEVQIQNWCIGIRGIKLTCITCTFGRLNLIHHAFEKILILSKSSRYLEVGLKASVTSAWNSSNISRKHTYIILNPVNPTFI